MKTKTILVTILGVLFTSCSVAHLLTDDTTQKFPPTNFENIEVYSTDRVDFLYQVIGEVVASAESLTDNGKVPVKYLKKEAAKLGADAIINLKLQFGHGDLANSITASGTAIKFTY